MHRNLGSTVTNAESSTNAESPVVFRLLASEKLRRLATCENPYKADNTLQEFRNAGSGCRVSASFW
jgi:hypothetical protein